MAVEDDHVVLDTHYLKAFFYCNMVLEDHHVDRTVLQHHLLFQLQEILAWEADYNTDHPDEDDREVVGVAVVF